VAPVPGLELARFAAWFERACPGAWPGRCGLGCWPAADPTWPTRWATAPAAGWCAGCRWGTCWRPRTTRAASTGSSPQAAWTRLGAV